MRLMLLTIRRKLSFRRTVETRKWFCKRSLKPALRYEPRTLPGKEEASREAAGLTPGLGARTSAAHAWGSKMPLGAGAQLDLGRSCAWYQMKRSLMTAITRLHLSPSSQWKGDVCRSVSNERMQRDSESRWSSSEPEIKLGSWNSRVQL